MFMSDSQTKSDLLPTFIPVFTQSFCPLPFTISPDFRRYTDLMLDHNSDGGEREITYYFIHFIFQQ